MRGFSRKPLIYTTNKSTLELTLKQYYYEKEAIYHTYHSMSEC